jgi:hypothetical protein
MRRAAGTGRSTDSETETDTMEYSGFDELDKRLAPLSGSGSRAVGSSRGWMHFLIPLMISIAGIVYYLYLNSLYIIDDILELPRLPYKLENELITIRVECAFRGDCSNVDTFVRHYAQCPITYQIQVFHSENDWKSRQYNPKIQYFYFDDAFASWLASADNSIPTATEGILI